jgi:hypothetical protein
LNDVSTGQILARTFGLFRANMPLSIFALVALSALGVFIDATFDRVTLIDSIASLAAQYFVTRGLLAHGSNTAPPGGFGAVFAVCLLSNIAILLGLLLLVVPGLVLALRWFLAVPIVMVEDDGAKTALRKSWDRTRGISLSVLGALIALYAPLLLIAVGALFWGAEEIGISPIASFATNLAVYFGAVGGWHAAVATYELRAGSDGALQDIFA